MPDGDLPDLDRAYAVSQRAPSDLASVQAGRANSGKWHLTGEHGCPNSSINANINSTTPVTALSKGRRDWCYYCEMQLEIYQLQAEVERLKSEPETDATDRFEYLVIANCDHCGQAVKYVEEFEKPVALDRGVSIKWAWCPYCGEGPGWWDVTEEYEIERVEPTDPSSTGIEQPEEADRDV